MGLGCMGKVPCWRVGPKRITATSKVFALPSTPAYRTSSWEHLCYNGLGSIEEPVRQRVRCLLFVRLRSWPTSKIAESMTNDSLPSAVIDGQRSSLWLSDSTLVLERDSAFTCPHVRTHPPASTKANTTCFSSSLSWSYTRPVSSRAKRPFARRDKAYYRERDD